MMQVRNWQENQIVHKEVKSCDNKGLGDIKELDSMYLLTIKSDRIMRIPKSAIATFDGDKVWLRATEAEVLAGVYPFTPAQMSEERQQAEWDRNKNTQSSAGNAQAPRTS